MFVPEKLKLNKLVQVDIPKGRDIYRSVNQNMVIPDSAYSGDSPASFSNSKIQDIKDIEAYDRMMQEKEERELKESKS